MDDKIVFEKGSSGMKNPKHMQRNVFYFIHRDILKFNRQVAKKLIKK